VVWDLTTEWTEGDGIECDFFGFTHATRIGNGDKEVVDGKDGELS
jgi:hypothetical protein